MRRLYAMLAALAITLGVFAVPASATDNVPLQHDHDNSINLRFNESRMDVFEIEQGFDLRPHFWTQANKWENEVKFWSTWDDTDPADTRVSFTNPPPRIQASSDCQPGSTEGTGSVACHIVSQADEDWHFPRHDDAGTNNIIIFLRKYQDGTHYGWVQGTSSNCTMQAKYWAPKFAAHEMGHPFGLGDTEEPQDSSETRAVMYNSQTQGAPGNALFEGTLEPHCVHNLKQHDYDSVSAQNEIHSDIHSSPDPGDSPIWVF